MERIVYDRMAELDSRHWWYRARREILADLIERRIALPDKPRILEIGCGTGHNIVMLKRFGRVDAIEIDPAARAIASQRLGHAVMDAPLPALTGVEDGAYDLVAILDVLEHVEEHRPQAPARRPDPDRGAGAPVDVERPRRRQPPQAPLHPQDASRRRRRGRAEAGDDELVQQPALPARRRRPPRRQGAREGG
jgi:SAM-dependent methyltransferase